MFSAIKRLFAPKAPAPEPDAIVDALRAGRKDEAVRLVAEAGVWIPHRDQKEEANGSISVRYYDTGGDRRGHAVPFTSAVIGDRRGHAVPFTSAVMGQQTD